MKVFFVIFFVLLSLQQGVLAQSPFPNARDDNYPLLGLKRAKSAYEKTLNDYQRNQELFARQLIAQRELDATRTAFSDAEVNYQQSLLVLLFEQQFISILDAVKRKDESGNIRVSLTLSNTTGKSAEFAQLENMNIDRLLQGLRTDRIHNVYVSLSNEENAIISKPYETKIDELISGEPHTVEFDLLQDVDAITVNLIYGNGASRSPKVYLRKDASANRLLVRAESFSQEIELGSTASFPLNLELFSGTEDTYQLLVANLPDEISRTFKDNQSQARLSQIRFTESANALLTNLELTLPDRPSEHLPLDKPISFFVMAVPRNRATEMRQLSFDKMDEEELNALEIGYARLELTAKGVGKLVVKAPQLYKNVLPGAAASFTFTLSNEGTRSLENVEFEIDAPLNWAKDVSPLLIRRLDIREEIQVTLSLTPAPSTSVGRYQTRMRTTALSNNSPIPADTKIFAIQIDQESNPLTIAFLALLILGLIGGFLWMGIKLARK